MTDINYIFDINESQEKVKATLILSPVSTISISTKKGTYTHSSLKNISKHNVCGMIENVLGLHIPKDIREEIIKSIIKDKKKKKLIDANTAKQLTSNLNYTDPNDKTKSYLPLLIDSFDIIDVKYKDSVKFVDSYSYLNTRIGDKPHITGSQPHINGAKNVGSILIPFKSDASVLSVKKADTITDEDKNVIEVIKEQLPQHYTSLYKREHEIIQDDIIIELNINNLVYEHLKNRLATNKVAYLGNSESIVNINII